VVSPGPQLTVTNNAPTICSPASTSIALSSTTSGAVISWTSAAVAGVTGNADGTGTSIAQTLTSTNTTPTTVSYVVSVTANGCTAPTQTVNVVVNPTPQVTITNNDDSLCSGETSNIALSSTVAGTVFNWTVVTGGSAGASAGSGSSIAQQLTNLGTSPITVTYAVTPTFTNAGVTCTGTTQNVSVVVSPGPQLTVTNNAPTICNPASTNIALSSTTSGAAISWTTAAVAGVSGNVDGTGTSIAQTLTSTNTTPTTVSYVVSVTANGCTAPTQTVNVVVNPTPQVTITNNDDSLCSGETSNIALSSTVAGTVFNWTVVTGGSAGASAGSGSSIAQQLTNLGTSPITVTYAVTPSIYKCRRNMYRNNTKCKCCGKSNTSIECNK
jgi:predicted Fe-Mo cluster-binding NifX family protein